MPTSSQAAKVRFGPYELSISSRELRKFGKRIRIQQQPLKILGVLVERPGELVTREQLRERLWPDGLYLDFEHGLNRAVNKLRRALLDSADSPRYIETLPARGYRFIAPVEVLRDRPDGPEVLQGEAELSALIEPSEVPLRTPSAVSIEVEAGIATPQKKRWVTIASAAAILLLFAGIAVIRPHINRASVPIAKRTLLLILPFENLTGDLNQEYFCDGMTEELIARMGSLDPDHLGVIARTTAMHYKGTSKTIKEIAGELGVSYVLENSIREVDHRVRVTSQLIQVKDQRHLWAQSFDRDSSDILGLQYGVSLLIAQDIPSYLGISKQPGLQPTSPVNSEAYTDYLKGRFFWNERSLNGLNKGVFYFQKAIQEDPQYARAYAGLADSYLVLGGGFLPPHETYLKGASAAKEALALDSDLAEAHASLAYFKFIDEWDWAGSDSEFQRAIALDPGYATAHHWYALYLSAMNRMPESRREIEKALELDPLSTVINSNAAAVFYQSGDFTGSLKQLQKTLELDPNFVPAYGYRGYVYQVSGKYEEALAEYRKAQQVSGDPLAYIGDVGRIYALTGRKAQAQEILDQVQVHSNEPIKVSAYTLCLMHASLGETDEAFKWLKSSIDNREFTATELVHDLRIENLREDPRFAEFRRQFGILDSKGNRD